MGDTMREAFEKFAQDCPMGRFSVDRKGEGYWSSHTQIMWDTWKAAHEAGRQLGMAQRFSKTRALLDKRAARIARDHQFNRSEGWAQLREWISSDDSIERAVAYGRMIAFEQFAEAICENFEFDKD